MTFFFFCFNWNQDFCLLKLFHNYCVTAKWFLSNFEEISVLKLNFESITFFVVNVIFNYKWQHQEFNSYFPSWQSSLIIMSFENWNSNLFCCQCLGMKKINSVFSIENNINSKYLNGKKYEFGIADLASGRMDYLMLLSFSLTICVTNKLLAS